jgi:hypothetical protein
MDTLDVAQRVPAGVAAPAARRSRGFILRVNLTIVPPVSLLPVDRLPLLY